MPKKSEAVEAGASTVLTFPGPGREEGAAVGRRVFLTQNGDPFEVQLAGNTLLVPRGTVEIESKSPEWTSQQVALHIASQCSKRAGYSIEEK